MILIAIVIILVGVFFIAYEIIKNNNNYGSFIIIWNKYCDYKLLVFNIINLVILYAVVSSLLYFFDPFNVKAYTISINFEALITYNLGLFHPYSIRIIDSKIYLALLISVIIDFVIFGILGLLSLLITNNKSSIIINFVLFYISIVLLIFITV